MSDQPYTPVYAEGAHNWYPQNRAAQLLSHLNHVVSDIQKLNELRLRVLESDPILGRLLFKYILVEYISLIVPLRELIGVAFKTPKLIKGAPAPRYYITKVDWEDLKRLYQHFNRGHSECEKELTAIRNRIGAHRPLENLSATVDLWEKIVPSQYVPVIDSALALIDRLGELEIFSWSRWHGDNIYSIISGRIVHPWEDAFEEKS